MGKNVAMSEITGFLSKHRKKLLLLILITLFLLFLTKDLEETNTTNYNNSNRVKLLDEANLIINNFYIQKDHASPSQPLYCYFILNNTGNVTAQDIKINLYYKTENISYQLDQSFNYNDTIEAGKKTSYIDLYIAKNTIGNYSYYLHVKYNYTWASTNYTKNMNS
jgi:hypothetical protein